MTSTLYIYSFNIQPDLIKDPLNPSMGGTRIGWKKEMKVPSVQGLVGWTEMLLTAQKEWAPLRITTASLSDINRV